MPRYKPYDYRQDLMVPIKLEAQLPEGSLEYALHHLIEERCPRVVRALYRTYEIGAARLLAQAALKVILLGYARGIHRLAPGWSEPARRNITFLALACGIRPIIAPLTAFVGKLAGRIELIFSEVLLVCHEEVF